MRRTAITICVLLLTLGGSEPQAQVPGLDITGKLLIQGIRDAANGIVDNAGNELRASAVEATRGLNQVAAELERILGANIEKPISELRKTFEVEIERAQAAQREALYFLDSTRGCLKNDLAGLLAGLDGTVSQNIANAIPWADKGSIITRLVRVGADAPYGIRVAPIQTLLAEGTNLEFDATCGVSAQLKETETAAPKTLELNVLGGDRRKLTLLVRDLLDPGVYQLTVNLGRKRRYWFGCSKPVVAHATVAVLPTPKFKIEYELTPTCAVSEHTAFEAGEVHGTNDACDGDRTFGGNFSLPSPWSYVRHDWIPTSVNGCEGGASYAGGNVVTVSYRCPEKGGIFCTGPRKWVHGRMVIHGTKDATAPGTTIRGEFPDNVGFGQTVSVSPVTPESGSCRTDSWTVAAKLVYPDGVSHSIPARAGSGALASSADGSAFSWEPSVYSLSVTTPPNKCSGL